MQNQKILIVDDEEPVRRLLARWLAKWGYGRVRDVGSALEAMDTMKTDPADIVLCDVSMPEYDGLWLAEQLEACWPKTAVIMSTGLDDPTTIRASRLLGAIAYVTKPFDPALLQQALERASGELQLRPSAEPQTPKRSDGPLPKKP